RASGNERDTLPEQADHRAMRIQRRACLIHRQRSGADAIVPGESGLRFAICVLRRDGANDLQGAGVDRSGDHAVPQAVGLRMKSLFRLRSSSHEGPPEVASPISLNKLCEAEDFRNLVLLEVMRRVQTDKVQEHGRDWPRGMEWRKDWEVA